jgi:hypothetical protein
MKKVIFALAAVVALAACSKEQTVVADRGDAIGFDSFIENATRAAADDFTSVDSFKVWGNVTGNAGSIFLYNGANVTRNGVVDGAAFTCDQTEYWIPSATYNFLAIAGATSVDPDEGAFPTTINYTANGTTDLLLSEYVTVETDRTAMPTIGVIVDKNDSNNKCVPFTFKHLLSKVYFNFKNTSTSVNSTYEISNIKISGAKATSTYDIETETWASATGTASDFEFGDAGTIAQGASVTSENARLFIPGEQSLTVSFTQTYKYNGSAVNKPETVTATLTRTFAANGCYVINVELKGGTAISFTLDALDGWDNKTDISIP